MMVRRTSFFAQFLISLVLSACGTATGDPADVAVAATPDGDAPPGDVPAPDGTPADVAGDAAPADSTSDMPDVRLEDPDLIEPGPDTVSSDGEAPPDAQTGETDVFVWNPDDDTLPVFEDGVVKTLDLTFTQSDLDGFLGCWQNPSSDVLSGKAKCWFKCVAALDGQSSVEAGCRPKGSPKKWNEQFKPQLIVRFDHWQDKGRFFGLRRFNLEASPDHPAPVRDQLGMGFMRDAGLPAPRVSLMRVRVNAEEWGPYQCIEPIDKEFLSDHYPDAEGDLYDDDLELATNESTSDGSRLEAFFDTAKDASPGDDLGQTLADLDVLADLPAFVKHAAAEAALATVDNFIDGAGNTYFYDRIPEPGLSPIPWDLDDIFSEAIDPNEPLDTCQGPSEFANKPEAVCKVLQGVLATRTSLRAEVKRLRDDVYPGLTARAEALCALARPPFLLDPLTPFSAAEFDADCETLVAAIAARAAFLQATPDLQ